MSKMERVAEGYTMPEADFLLSGHEVLSRKVLREQEYSERALSHAGRWLLGNTIPDRHPILESPLDVASTADWECLEAEKPELHNELAPIAASMLNRAGIALPYSTQLAEIHDLGQARARREAAVAPAGHPAAPGISAGTA